MNRRAWLVASVFASACASEPPPCPTVRGELDLEVRDVAPVGLQDVTVAWDLRGAFEDTRVEVGAWRLDGGVLVEESSVPVTDLFARASWALPVEEPVVFLAGARLTCGGRTLASTLRSITVLAEKHLDRQLPRRCELLQPVRGDLLDCDGQVIDLDGGLVPGWHVAPHSWTVMPVRWTYVRALGEVGFEPGDGGLLTTLLPPVASWTVAETFAVLGSEWLVEPIDGGLVSSPLDAGGAWTADEGQVHVCAATSREGRRSVGVCKESIFETWWGPQSLVGFWRCEVSGGRGEVASLQDCERFEGDLVSRDPRSGLIGLNENFEVRWLELATGSLRPPVSILPLGYHGGPGVGGFGGAMQVGLGSSSNVPPRNAVIVDLDRPRLVAFRTDAGVRTTADLAWEPGDETAWTWLREP